MLSEVTDCISLLMCWTDSEAADSSPCPIHAGVYERWL